MKRFVVATLAALAAILLLQRVLTRRGTSFPSGAAPRIVSLAPNLTELLFELDVGDQLVGVTNYCTYPPKAQQKEKIGDFVNPSVEKIVELNPDLVFAERWTSSKIVSHLRALGIEVRETLSPKSISEIYELIGDVGAAVGESDRAQALVQSMKQRIGTIERRARLLPHRPLLYVEIDLPTWTVGRDSFLNEAITLCGARNIFEDVGKPALQVSKEKVVQYNPEVVLSFQASASAISQRPGWGKISAVRSDKIIDDLNPDLLSRGSHRLVDGMEALQERLLELMKE